MNLHIVTAQLLPCKPSMWKQFMHYFKAIIILGYGNRVAIETNQMQFAKYNASRAVCRQKN